MEGKVEVGGGEAAVDRRGQAKWGGEAAAEAAGFKARRLEKVIRRRGGESAGGVGGEVGGDGIKAQRQRHNGGG
jgi:hypothetical protein